MAPEIVVDSIPTDSKRSLRVLDPMCGSGTVLSVASERGHRAIGRDIDPLAVLMSRVATAEVDVEQLLGVGSYVLAAAERSTAKTSLWRDEETNAFAEYWFGEQQRTQLTRLSRKIQAVSVSTIKMALQVALSRIIITKSPRASLAADTSHSRPHRTQLSSDFDVYEGFQASLLQVARLLENRTMVAPAAVEIGDARRLGGVRTSSIDLLITSPPYLNAIDYMRGHRLALIWLGFSLAELSGIRRASIGAERRLATNDGLIKTIMAGAIESSSTSSDAPYGMVARYCSDMLAFSNEAKRVVRPGGSAVLVVGNCTVRGNFIKNDFIMVEAMSQFGFRLESRFERELPINKRYLPIKAEGSSGLDGRMRTEVVLRMRLGESSEQRGHKKGKK